MTNASTNITFEQQNKLLQVTLYKHIVTDSAKKKLNTISENKYKQSSKLNKTFQPINETQNV